MKTIRTALVPTVLLLGLAASGFASAHDRVGAVIGGTIFWPGYYGTPNYYAPYYAPFSYPFVAAPAQPTAYIERSGNEAAPTEALEHWNYYLRYREELLRSTSSSIPAAGRV